MELAAEAATRRGLALHLTTADGPKGCEISSLSWVVAKAANTCPLTLVRTVKDDSSRELEKSRATLAECFAGEIPEHGKDSGLVCEPINVPGPRPQTQSH